jgi:hypothetical protein
MEKIIQRIDLEVFDSPEVYNLGFKGVSVQPLGLDTSSGAVELLVEVTGKDAEEATEHNMVVEAHGTGWPIPFVDDLEYLGTVMNYGFVWHVFYMFRQESGLSEEESENKPAFDHAEIRRNCCVIYKYDLVHNGRTDLKIPSPTARPLHVNWQYGQLRLWLLRGYSATEGAETELSITTALPQDGSLGSAEVCVNGEKTSFSFPAVDED